MDKENGWMEGKMGLRIALFLLWTKSLRLYILSVGVCMVVVTENRSKVVESRFELYIS